MDELPLSILENMQDAFDVFSAPSMAGDGDASEDGYDRELLGLGLYPPLPVMGEYLVWGFRILESLKAAGDAAVRTVRLPDDPAEAITAALKLEGRKDGYSWEEKAGISDLVDRFGLSEPEKRRIERLVQTRGSFLAALNQYRHLPTELKSLVEEGAVDLKTARTVRDLPTEVISRLKRLAAGLSFSRRRELFLLFNEIVFRDAPEEAEISEFLSRVEEAADPVETVRRARFPELDALEESFAVFKERFLGGSGIELRAPKNFEGSRFSVSFSFETDRQLDRILDTLETLRGNTDELYRLLYGPLRPDLSD
ncbi:MAG: hypothetical protein ACLFRY_07370 [Spirochaetia bacterium]